MRPKRQLSVYLNNLVEFAALEPSTVAFRAIIYFDAVFLASEEGDGMVGTIHGPNLGRCCSVANG